MNLPSFGFAEITSKCIWCRWFHESPRWLVLNNNSEQAVKNLKSVAKFNGRHKDGEKLNVKVRHCGAFVLLDQLSFQNVSILSSRLSSCVDGARVHEERAVRFARLLLCPGSVPHSHNEIDDNCAQCCLVRVLHLVLIYSKWHCSDCSEYFSGYRQALPTTVFQWTCRSLGWTST